MTTVPPFTTVLKSSPREVEDWLRNVLATWVLLPSPEGTILTGGEPVAFGDDIGGRFIGAPASARVDAAPDGERLSPLGVVITFHTRPLPGERTSLVGGCARAEACAVFDHILYDLSERWPEAGRDVDRWVNATMQECSFVIPVPVATISSFFPRILGGVDAALGTMPSALQVHRTENLTTEQFVPEDPSDGIYITHHQSNDPDKRRLLDLWQFGRRRDGLVHHTASIMLWEKQPGETYVEVYWSADLDEFMRALFAEWHAHHPDVPADSATVALQSADRPDKDAPSAPLATPEAVQHASPTAVLLPEQPARLIAWRETWRLIRQMAGREDVKKIADWLNKEHRTLPHSPKTVRKIIAAGRAGHLSTQ